MNRLDAKTRTAILNCLIEGCSIRSHCATDRSIEKGRLAAAG
jgi:hypothetical protein